MNDFLIINSPLRLTSLTSALGGEYAVRFLFVTFLASKSHEGAVKGSGKCKSCTGGVAKGSGKLMLFVGDPVKGS